MIENNTLRQRSLKELIVGSRRATSLTGKYEIIQLKPNCLLTTLVSRLFTYLVFKRIDVATAHCILVKHPL